MSCDNRSIYLVMRKSNTSKRSRRADLLVISTLVVMSGLALSGCVTNPVTANPSSPAGSAAPSAPADPAGSRAEPIDPLDDLKDPDSTDYVEGELSPVIHEKGTGPMEFEIERPDESVTGLKYFVSCEPSSTFTVTESTFYSGPCSTHFSNSGSVPLSPGDGPLSVSIDIPEDITFWLVALPVQ